MNRIDTIIWDSRRTGQLAAELAEVRSPVMLHTGDPILMNALIFHTSHPARMLAPAHWNLEQVREAAMNGGASSIVQGSFEKPTLEQIERIASPSSDPNKHDRIGIFTSGTTGKPKLVWQTIKSLTASAGHAARLGPLRWLMAYEPTSYAGLQVMLAARAGGGSVVYAPSSDWENLPHLIIESSVQAISATPTWWRLLLQVWPKTLQAPTLRQISLGGERVDQDILDRLNEFFKPTGLTHIYASTEAGTAIVVSDRRAGFPAAWLNNPSRRPALREAGNFLELSPDGEHWQRSPDWVEVKGDRVYFTGRSEALLNIGGAKVSPEAVESAMLSLGWFADVRVFSKSNPLTGQLLAAEVVPLSGQVVDIPVLKTALAERLPRHAVPQWIKVVQQLQLSSHGKKLRH